MLFRSSAQVILNTDPNGPSITRNSNGDLIGVTTTYFNEESTEVSGVDLSFNRLLASSDTFRSEERRVGKECRSRWSPYH